MDAESMPLQGLESDNKHRSLSIHCANCDIEILWTPVFVQGKAFCCTGCAAGGPCNCDYSQFRSTYISGVLHYGLDEDQPSANC